MNNKHTKPPNPNVITGASAIDEHRFLVDKKRHAEDENRQVMIDLQEGYELLQSGAFGSIPTGPEGRIISESGVLISGPPLDNNATKGLNQEARLGGWCSMVIDAAKGINLYAVILGAVIGINLIALLIARVVTFS